MQSSPEIVDIIRENVLFIDIDNESLLFIAELLRLKSVNKNDFVYRKGETAEGLYLVVSGNIDIIAERDGDEFLLSHTSAPYLFGEFLLQGNSVRSTSAKALTDSQLLFFSKNSFHDFSQKSPEQASVLAKRILNRLCWNQTSLALRLSHLFVGLNEEVVRHLIHNMQIQSVPSNTLLIKQGTIGNELWVVIDGQFQILKKSDDGKLIKLATLGRGEAIGEIAVSCNTPRRSDVLATRDSTVAKLSKESFERILKQYPVEINRAFVKSVVGHLQRGHASKQKSAETFALVMLSQISEDNAVPSLLIEALKHYGSAVAIGSGVVDVAFNQPNLAQASFGDVNNTALLQWLCEQEIAHRHIIYIVDNDLSNWTLRCLRQADHIIFCADVLDNPEVSPFEKLVLQEIKDKDVEQTLVLLHPDSTKVPESTSAWLTNRKISLHHHVRSSNQADFGRVARFLTGNAVGLVLGGGGARGLAHIGVMRAFKDLNIPIDLIGGNSMGAVIAAQYAMQWSFSDMLKKTTALCLQGDQFTLPIMSLFSGNKMTRGLEKMFDRTHIEDLWLHFFSISCNISRATVMTHDKGPLIAAVLNSNAPPGLFPPQVVDGDLLVDGALLNNVPVDVMAKLNVGGTIIAVDVNAREDLLNNTDNSGGMSGWTLFFNKINPKAQKIKNPSMIEVLMRASIIGGLAQRKKLMNGIADLYLQPPVNKFSLMAYKEAKQIEEVGYQHAMKALKVWQLTINKRM